MKEFKALTESQLELLETKVQQIQVVLNQAQVLQNQNSVRIERMKIELDIPQQEAKNGRWVRMGRDLSGRNRLKRLPSRIERVKNKRIIL